MLISEGKIFLELKNVCVCGSRVMAECECGVCLVNFVSLNWIQLFQSYFLVGNLDGEVYGVNGKQKDGDGWYLDVLELEKMLVGCYNEEYHVVWLQENKV